LGPRRKLLEASLGDSLRGTRSGPFKTGVEGCTAGYCGARKRSGTAPFGAAPPLQGGGRLRGQLPAGGTGPVAGDPRRAREGPVVLKGRDRAADRAGARGAGARSARGTARNTFSPGPGGGTHKGRESSPRPCNFCPAFPPKLPRWVEPPQDERAGAVGADLRQTGSPGRGAEGCGLRAGHADFGTAGGRSGARR